MYAAETYVSITTKMSLNRKAYHIGCYDPKCDSDNQGKHTGVFFNHITPS